MDEIILGERYVLEGPIGRGGMSDVCRARDTRLERDVAIKRLSPRLADDPAFRKRFAREARAVAGLSHPNIVAVYDTGEYPDETTSAMIPYIVMELVVGETLRERLNKVGKFSPTNALEIIDAVLEALGAAHGRGIVHRDIKPANIMLTPDGLVKVMDFGIARIEDTKSDLTTTGAVLGTPQYLSPEQVRGETADLRSDLYAAGCLLYELATGNPPFVGGSAVSLAYQHVEEAPALPSSLDQRLPAGFDAITMKALAKLRQDRYQNAAE
ncbi:MAG: protein kinase, partial [Propionibacteriaceae bacterium]|nr:protein kinase [Propionibacteriaceae bacterium]